jgi:hypothetical protein
VTVMMGTRFRIMVQALCSDWFKEPEPVLEKTRSMIRVGVLDCYGPAFLATSRLWRRCLWKVLDQVGSRPDGYLHDLVAINAGRGFQVVAVHFAHDGTVLRLHHSVALGDQLDPLGVVANLGCDEPVTVTGPLDEFVVQIAQKPGVNAVGCRRDLHGCVRVD